MFLPWCELCHAITADGDHTDDYRVLGEDVELDEDGEVVPPPPAVEAERLAAFAEYLEPDPTKVWVVSEAVPKPRR